MDIKGNVLIDKEKMVMTFKGKVTVYRSLGTGVELKSKTAGAFGMMSKVEAKGQAVASKIAGQMTMETTATVK